MNKKFTVVGQALDSKGTAIVKTDSTFYIIEGLDRWDSFHYAKRVQVKGKLKIEHHEKRSADSILIQERLGTWLIIRHPKWSLVE